MDLGKTDPANETPFVHPFPNSLSTLETLSQPHNSTMLDARTVFQMFIKPYAAEWVLPSGQTMRYMTLGQVQVARCARVESGTLCRTWQGVT